MHMDGPLITGLWEASVTRTRSGGCFGALLRASPLVSIVRGARFRSSAPFRLEIVVALRGSREIRLMAFQARALL